MHENISWMYCEPILCNRYKLLFPISATAHILEFFFFSWDWIVQSKFPLFSEKINWIIELTCFLIPGRNWKRKTSTKFKFSVQFWNFYRKGHGSGSISVLPLLNWPFERIKKLSHLVKTIYHTCIKIEWHMMSRFVLNHVSKTHDIVVWDSYGGDVKHSISSEYSVWLLTAASVSQGPVDPSREKKWFQG